MNYHTCKNQIICDRLVCNEVLLCVSSLIYELTQKREYFDEYEEDLQGAFEGIPDYEEAVRYEIKDYNVQNIKNLYKFLLTETITKEIVGATGQDCSVLLEKLFSFMNPTDWREVATYIGIEPNKTEISEHWAVTDGFGDKLEAHGEKVLKDFFGLTVWCRVCGGRAIFLDHVIGEIGEEMEILEGMKNEWSTV